MRRIAFIIAILGIAALLHMLISSNPIKISSPEELDSLVDNSLVQTSGKVASERILYERTKLLKLDNNIELVCESCPAYSNKTIQVMGTAEKYLNKTQIQVLRIIPQD